MGGTGPRPVPSGDSPDGTGTTPCGNECLPTVGAPSSFRPASGRAARAGRPCHPDKCEISGLAALRVFGGRGRRRRTWLFEKNHADAALSGLSEAFIEVSGGSGGRRR